MIFTFFIQKKATTFSFSNKIQLNERLVALFWIKMKKSVSLFLLNYFYMCYKIINFWKRCTTLVSQKIMIFSLDLFTIRSAKKRRDWKKFQLIATFRFFFDAAYNQFEMPHMWHTFFFFHSENDFFFHWLIQFFLLDLLLLLSQLYDA